ncbi:MAG: pirin family protein [Microcoleaceae cyanobacterium]
MISLRKAQARGHANHGWLNTYHTFSFANYFDPQHMGFRSLRVINEDTVSPRQGFGTHGHRDMEIITYVLEGGLEHKDSVGNGAVLHPGEVQHISAGTGIMHSEYNHSKSEPVHFLQIWLLPDTKGLKPSYGQRAFDLRQNSGKLTLVAAKDGRNGALKVNQDVNLFAGILKKSDQISYSLPSNRHGWIQVARGEINLNGLFLEVGDGAALSDVNDVSIEANSDAEILLFDLA